MPKVYSLSEGERAIFQRATEQDNPNIFTGWFLKSPTSGTYFKPDVLDLKYEGSFPEIYDEWVRRYKRLHERWAKTGRNEVFEFKNKRYQAQKVKGDTRPTFFLPHGFMFQPWQLDVHRAPQRIRVVIGGYGSGKTLSQVASMLYWAATVPNFRGVALAPNSTQAREAFRMAIKLFSNTPFREKFVIRTVVSPVPTIIIGNDRVGDDNRIECYPIGDAEGVDKLETLNLDAAMIDQAEKLQNIYDIVRVVGSRFRGQVHGREVLGHMTFLANAKDNPELYELYDEQEKDPRRVASWSPSTADNVMITPGQLIDLEKDVGGSAEAVRVHMKGGRPLGDGKHFPQALLGKVLSSALDEKMEAGIKSERPGFIIEDMPKAGITRWEMPPEPGRNYVVIADPGTDNPPNRNSAAVMVWDYTDFPDHPATLQAFCWVYGFHRPEPWISQYITYVETYRAHLSNAFDSTGWQSGYLESFYAIDGMQPMGLSLAITHKATYLNYAKRLCEMEKMKMPSIPGIFDQLSRYRLPDNKLRQDLVMTFILSAGWLKNQFWLADTDDHAPPPQPGTEDRYYAPIESRYDKTAEPRY